MIMNKSLTVNFDPQDISRLIAELEIIDKQFKKLPVDIAKEVAYDGLTKLDMLYAINTGHDTGDIHTRVEETMNGYKIVAEGKDVLYEEFGTGEVGKDNPHPDKAEYPLNDYNSGPIVSTHINKAGRHYWFHDGVYTEGIPAGKQFFDTRNYIITEGIKKAHDKLVGDILSKH